MADSDELLSRTLRTQMAEAIVERIDQAGFATKAQAAEALGLTRARLDALRAGDVELISLDKLVDVADNLGLVVRVSVTRPWGQNR
jgi:predicted XRE-type DNA-binding protein